MQPIVEIQNNWVLAFRKIKTLFEKNLHFYLIFQKN